MSKITREQIEKIAAERAIAVAERLEEVQLNNELNYIQSEQYIADQMEEADKLTIGAVTKLLKAITSKSFSNYSEFSFGPANDLIAAIKTVTLQKKEGFAALNIAVAMDETNTLSNFMDIVFPHSTNIIDGLGRGSYFNTKADLVKLAEEGNMEAAIVPEIAPDAPKAKSALEAIGRKLGLATITFNQVNNTYINALYTNAANKAQQTLADQIELYAAIANGQAPDAEHNTVYLTK